MPLETDKTRQHLREQVLMQGEQERLRAMQALSHSYGTGSKAALATLLKAALGGVRGASELLVPESGMNSQAKRLAVFGQVAEPQQPSANDSIFDEPEVSTGS